VNRKAQFILPSAVLLWVALVLLLAQIRPVSATQATEEQLKALEPTALANVAARTGLAQERLAVANSAIATFPSLGRLAYSFKISDLETGDSYGIDLDDKGQAVDLEQWFSEERAAFDAIYGGVQPALAERLTDATEDAQIPVIIWLHEEAYTPPAPPPADRVSSVRAVDAYLAQANSLRQQAVAQVTAPVVTRLEALGIAAEADALVPLLFAVLTPDQIGQVATWSEVDTLYLDTPAEPTLDVARATIFANVVHNRGIDGSGVRVAELEAEGGRAYLHPAIAAGIVNDNAYSCPSVHGTHVAGIIRSADPFYRGIAPNVLLRVGGSCDGDMSEIRERSGTAVSWGARILNLSFGHYSGLTPDGYDRFYDELVRNYRRSVIVSAGNRGTAGCLQGTNGAVTSPGLAFNVVTVGNFDDRNTVTWADDVMAPCSSWRDPYSSYSDREKPEVAAPGTDIISTWDATSWGSLSGTSMAAPMVTGSAALLVQRNPAFGAWPEIVKAILMASAYNNIEGDSRLSEYDGAGGIATDAADDIARGWAGNWGGIGYACSRPTNLNLATMNLFAGRPTRAVIAWDTATEYDYYYFRPSADLDLEVLDPSGNVVVRSNSYDNTYEIVEFTPAVSGNYTLRVVKWRCDADPGYLGFAWRRLW
jgi:hypothetical protein